MFKVVFFSISPRKVFKCFLKSSSRNELQSHWLQLFDFCQYVFLNVFSKSILEKKNNCTLVQFFSTVSFQIRRQMVCTRGRIVTLVAFIWFSPLCFLRASSNISLNWLSKRMRNHTYCICLIFHHCVLFYASSNYKVTLFAFVWLLPGVYNQ